MTTDSWRVHGDTTASTMTTPSPAKIKDTFPYFGGKSAVAGEVWKRFGNPGVYAEPFCGSLAVLLARPGVGRYETVNDADCMIANFWRAVKNDPGTVADYADGPVVEVDLHARWEYLNHGYMAEDFRKRMRTYPHYYDAAIAGWWVWGQSCAIGREWAMGTKSMPVIIHRKGVSKLSLGKNPKSAIRDWMLRLQSRLRLVSVLCGDWSRSCGSYTTTTYNGTCAVFLDPPYSAAAKRHNRLYAKESGTVAHDVRAWCMKYGDNPDMRIALCGYEGEHDEL